MPSVTDLKAKIRQLTAEQKSILDDPRLSNQAKCVRFDRIDDDIHTALRELNNTQRGNKAYGAGGSAAGVDTVGGRFADQAGGLFGIDESELKAFHDAAQHRVDFRVTSKASTVSTVTPGGIPQFVLPPVPMLREPFRVANLLPVTSTTAGFVSYFVTTTGATAAAAVAEGALKPLSSYAVSQTTVGMTKIAHRVEVTEELIADYSNFLGVLEQDMSAGLLNAENAALLNFDQTAPQTFKGLLNVAGTLTASAGTGETKLDAIENGFTALRTGSRFVEPDGVVLNPNDFAAIRKLKNSMGGYLFGDPVDAAPDRMWGVPVKMTTQCPAGTAIVANFRQSCLLYMREGLSLRLNNFGENLWNTNTVSVIAEERLVLTVPAPAAICKVTLP